MYEYNPEQVEAKWQAYWDEQSTFKVGEDTSKPKYYVLDMFPYPSGAGLHVGHPEGYTATDIVARAKRMQGFNVLHPMGWDAFGLPAERAAVREQKHPADITKRNISNFKKQIKRLGLSYDWSREICTSDPDYYRWTQWIFLKLYEKDLAYLAEVPVNWCPAQGTVLANEEVVDGKYVETGDPVEKRIMRQWMLRITAYADRLLDGLEGLDWPKNVIDMQKNWIGRSEGAELSFDVQGHGVKLDVFTTRPETLYGSTFCVLAPDHPLLKTIVTTEQVDAVEAYCDKRRSLSDRDRDTLAGKEKTGVFTGSFVIHPLTDKALPIWVADYVKLGYGHGAIMAVPAEDERDQAFAEAYDLPVIPIIENGKMISSDHLDGLTIDQAKTKMIVSLEEKQLGKAKVTYKLRDWLFSRQRYWGEPFPMLYDASGLASPMNIDDLPLTLPVIEDFHPTEDGLPPLARAKDWVNSSQGMRELNTMPQWAGSCWYFLRYMDPNNDQAMVDPKKEAYWGQVDLYVGGLEHAVSHLLYSRFWYKVLFDCGVVSHEEPFKKLFNQGMILAYSYRDKLGKYHHPDTINLDENGKATLKESGETLSSMVEKMSKSKLNVVNPDDVVAEYGADALRLYEMFMGPLEATKPWQTNGVKGMLTFLQRIWRQTIDVNTDRLQANITDDEIGSQTFNQALNQTIDKVTNDIQALKFNTAIAQMMTFMNICKNEANIPKKGWEKFILVLAPFAPHIAEELWARLGHTSTLAYHTWPEVEKAFLTVEKVNIPLCLNGKKVSLVEVEKGISQAEMEALFLADKKIQNKMTDFELKKIIYVPNRLFNAIVVKK
ncbi:MAG: leucine--tRNA ligase [Pseudomonadota bacterium]|nr:leucine--tRNA ligase [Pseudomonadota bacterium]